MGNGRITGCPKKNTPEKIKKGLTAVARSVMITGRLCGRNAMMREIARETGVTSAEYVRKSGG